MPDIETPGVYQWDAAEYARHSRGQFEWAQDRLNELALHGTEWVLDVGCGDGKISAAIAGRLLRGLVFGVDNSASMLALARRRFPAALHPNLAFARMDAAQLAFGQVFDVVFSNAALHWVPDHPAVLAGVRRSLKPGGKLHAEMGGAGNAAQVIEVLDEVRARDPWQGYFAGFAFPYRFYTPEVYAPWLHAAGLVPERLTLAGKDMQHDGLAGLSAWLRTAWLPYTERVPAALRETFIDAVSRAYLDRYPLDPQSMAHVPMVRLQVEARRPAVGII